MQTPPARLGDLLVKRGVLSEQQRDEILKVQDTGARPFGALAEELFGISPEAVEHAWAEQFAMLCPRIDPRQTRILPEVLARVDRRQAWQFGVIPVRQTDEELLVVTSVEHLARAMRFVGWRVAGPVSFATCDRDALVIALGVHYNIAGLDQEFIDQVAEDLAA